MKLQRNLLRLGHFADIIIFYLLSHFMGYWNLKRDSKLATMGLLFGITFDTMFDRMGHSKIFKSVRTKH